MFVIDWTSSGFKIVISAYRRKSLGLSVKMCLIWQHDIKATSRASCTCTPLTECETTSRRHTGYASAVSGQTAVPRIHSISLSRRSVAEIVSP